MVKGDTFLVFDLGLDTLDGVTGLDLNSDGLVCQGLHKDLHVGVNPLGRRVEKNNESLKKKTKPFWDSYWG